MPSIEITGDQFQRLQKFAEPLIDTPQSAFAKVLALAEGRQPAPLAIENASDGLTIIARTPRYDRSNLPSVKHTYIRSAKIDGKIVAKNEWNASLLEVMAAVAARTSLLDALKGTPINATPDKRDGIDGYAWRANLNLSVQGVSAETASRAILQLGDTYAIPIRIEFGWHRSPKASKPGQEGILIAGPQH